MNRLPFDLGLPKSEVVYFFVRSALCQVVLLAMKSIGVKVKSWFAFLYLSFEQDAVFWLVNGEKQKLDTALCSKNFVKLP